MKTRFIPVTSIVALFRASGPQAQVTRQLFRKISPSPINTTKLKTLALAGSVAVAAAFAPTVVPAQETCPTCKQPMPDKRTTSTIGTDTSNGATAQTTPDIKPLPQTPEEFVAWICGKLHERGEIVDNDNRALLLKMLTDRYKSNNNSMVHTVETATMVVGYGNIRWAFSSERWSMDAYVIQYRNDQARRGEITEKP